MKVRNDTYVEWCECGTHPTPPDGTGDIVVEVISGVRAGTQMIMHPECVQRRRKRVAR